MKKYLLMACLLFSSTAQAQPEKVIVHKDGSVEVVQHSPALSSTDSAKINLVPVFTERSDGSHIQGILYYGENKNGNHFGSYPGRLVHNIDGSWQIEEMYWSIAHGPNKFSTDWIVPGTDFIPITHLEQPATAFRNEENNGLPLLTWNYDHAGAPLNVTEADARLTVLRVMSGYISLFKDDSLFSSFNFQWKIPDDDGLSNAAAWTTVKYQAKDLTTLRGLISSNYAESLTDMDPFETGIYNNFPLGTGINYYRYSGLGVTQIATASDILISNANLSTLNNSVPPESVEIFINPIANFWDARPQDGIGRTSAPRVDLANTLFHEVGHALGFTSNLEATHYLRPLPYVPSTKITHWDIYRFPGNQNPITPVFFRSAIRELRDGANANAVLQINSSQWATPLSTGDSYLSAAGTYPASHWLDNTLLTPPQLDVIGNMDPTASYGSVTLNGDYLRQTDIRAYDLLGYDIDTTNTIGITDLPTLAGPVSDAPIDRTQALALSWTQDASTTTTDILIYDLGLPMDGSLIEIPNSTLVYINENLTTSSLTIQPNGIALIPGHRYQWHATAYHPLGVNLSLPATFIVDGEVSPVGLCADQFESAKLLPPNGGDFQSNGGYTVAISGDIAVVGAPAYKTFEIGRTYVYRRSGSRWVHEQTLFASDAVVNDFFGFSVSTSGNVIVVGSGNGDQAYVFDYNGVSWDETAILTGSDSGGFDGFGTSVSISNNTIIVGAPYEGPGTTANGAAYVFDFDGVQWTETTKLIADDRNGSDEFGYSVSISGGVAAIGAWHDQVSEFYSGSTYMFRDNGTSWVQEAKLSPNDLVQYDTFGASVSVSGNSLVIGAHGGETFSPSSPGKAYAYRFDGSTWGIPQKLELANGINGENFGISVSISNDTIVVGADRVDGRNIYNSGTSHSYVYNGVQWIKRNSFFASDADSGDNFGHAVAVDGTTIVTGSYFEALSADFDLAGSAYIHELNPCPADLDGGGSLNFYDISLFLQLYAEQDPAADWNCDGAWNFFDNSAFLIDFDAGCP